MHDRSLYTRVFLLRLQLLKMTRSYTVNRVLPNFVSWQSCSLLHAKCGKWCASTMWRVQERGEWGVVSVAVHEVDALQLLMLQTTDFLNIVNYEKLLAHENSASLSSSPLQTGSTSFLLLAPSSRRTLPIAWDKLKTLRRRQAPWHDTGQVFMSALCPWQEIVNTATNRWTIVLITSSLWWNPVAPPATDNRIKHQVAITIEYGKLFYSQCNSDKI